MVRWDALARTTGTIVLLMAVENAPAIAAALVEGGRDHRTPVAVVAEGTMPGERTVLATLGTLADEIAAHQVRPPAVIVVGEVVAVAHPGHFA
jgi:uroporphyrin-III C-methyltransferase/precorrin-2 dehydrogenase/sirohydrochlorin ferrochelatase